MDGRNMANKDAAAGPMQLELVQDRKGMVWDLLLYIPTVIALASISASFWYGDNHDMGYLFFFLTCFFFIAGFNRVFKTRLMLLPSAPISLKVAEQSIGLVLRNGAQINLLKNLRYYSDYAGKSFGISGLDGEGKHLQFVFHRGQFATVDQYNSVQDMLQRHKK
jgi:hypothetical protein